MRKLGFGVVGLRRGVDHARRIVTSDRCELVALADTEEEVGRKVLRELGAKAFYRDYRDLLDRKDLDAVVISTPNHLHARMSVACLEAGLHVLVEKPMCTSMAEADQMITAAEKSGCKLYVGYNKRLAPSHRKVKELIDEGCLGRVVYVTSVMKDWRPASYYERARWHAKRETQGGGVLMNPGSHALDALLWWFGEAERVTGFCENLYHQVEVEDTASAFIKFRSGVTANLVATTALPLSMSRTEFDGTEASLSLDSGGLRIMVRNEGAWQTVDLPQIRGDTTDLQLSLFVDCIEKGTKPAVPPEQGRRAVELALAIYRSSELGQTVRIPL